LQHGNHEERGRTVEWIRSVEVDLHGPYSRWMGIGAEDAGRHGGRSSCYRRARSVFIGPDERGRGSTCRRRVVRGL
jgi:hypothetical protein